MKITKDARIIYESFRKETNRVIWNFWSYKTNPQNKSLENRPTKQIHDTNLLKKALRIESAIQIFKVWIRESGFASLPAWIRKDSFRAIVLRICQDSLGFVGFVKTGRIFGSSGHESNPRFESLRIGLVNPDSRICEVGFVNHKTKWIFLESGFVTTIQNESTFLRIYYTIPTSLKITLTISIKRTLKLSYIKSIRLPQRFYFFLSQYRVVVGNQTLIFTKENDPTLLPAPSTGKLIKFLVIISNDL